MRGTHFSHICLYVFSLVALVCAHVVAPQAASAGEWWDGFGPSVIDGAISDLDYFSGSLYVGGEFDVIGGVPADNVARYDGRRWRNVDGGTDGIVHTVFEHGTTVVLGGNFWNAGGTSCVSVARLDMGHWLPMDDGLPGWVNGFHVHNASLHACGSFDVDGDGYTAPVAVWFGDEWHDLLDSFDPTNNGYALAHFDGSLYIGGRLHLQYLDQHTYALTKWDGEDFYDFGFESGAQVYALQVHDNSLYVGGAFTNASVTESYGLVLLTAGGNFHPVAQPDVPRTVVDLEVWGANGLVVGQDDAVIRYHGTSWGDTLGGVIEGGVGNLSVVGTDLYVTGSFPGRVARWDSPEQEWVLLGGSPSHSTQPADQVLALCRHDGRLVAAGDFHIPSILANEGHSNNIGWWDGETWHRLGSGLNSSVYDIVSYDGDLIAAGWFDHAGGAPAARLARWDGEAWHSLGSPDGEVRTLAVWNGDLVIGGYFHNVGGVSAERVAAWNGTTWRALGPGFNTAVNDLVVHEGELYAAGNFVNSGGAPVHRVARWDGALWQPLGEGLDTGAYALCSHGGDLYAGGYFTQAGGEPADGVARWDGAAWHPLGAGVTGTTMMYKVATLASVAGELYVGGDFDTAGGALAAGLAVWNGATWREYEGGVQREGGYVVVHDLQIHEGDLYIGGNFDGVGGRGEASANLARWVDGTLVPVFLQDFTAAWTGARVELGWRVDGREDGDFLLLARDAAGEREVPCEIMSDGAGRAVDTPRRDTQPGEVVYELSWLDDGEPTLLERRVVQLPPLALTRLDGAHPNPFNPEVSVAFTVGRAGPVQLVVYDAAGRRVATLADRPFTAGPHAVSWDGRDDAGRSAASGTYVVRLSTDTGRDALKLVLVR